MSGLAVSTRQTSSKILGLYPRALGFDFVIDTGPEKSYAHSIQHAVTNSILFHIK